MADKNQEELQRIHDAISAIKQKPAQDVTEEDIGFLKARESYLSDADKDLYLSEKVAKKAKKSE